MCMFTPVKSRTHVDTVQTVLCGVTNWSDIYWSHTMKALGSVVTFVRRNLRTVVVLSYTYGDMKVWSRMFVVNVQSVSVVLTNWTVISSCTQTSEALPVVYVVNVLSTNKPFWGTLRDVFVFKPSFGNSTIVRLKLLWSHCCCSPAMSVWFCCHCDLSARCYVLRHSLNALPPLGHLRDVMLFVGMCRIDFFYFCLVSVRFLKKNSDSLRNKFGSVRFKKCGSVRIL